MLERWLVFSFFLPDEFVQHMSSRQVMYDPGVYVRSTWKSLRWRTFWVGWSGYK